VQTDSPINPHQAVKHISNIAVKKSA
jgi:hypothetical protein